MNSKEEKIKESYGEYWEMVKEYVDENGWCKKRKKVNFELIKSDIEIKEHEYHHYYWRPKSLQGVENNSGWIKIEYEEDLPKKGEYDISSFKLWLWTNNGFYEYNDYKKWKLHYEHLEITHYQLKTIEKPKPPIY